MPRERFASIPDDALPPRHAAGALRRQSFCGIPEALGDVRVVVEFLVPQHGQPAGARGLVEPFMGFSLYDLHQEVPVNGSGVPYDSVVVLERAEDGTLVRTPYWDWVVHVGAHVRCNRCRHELIKVKDEPCEWQVERQAANDELRREEDQLRARRKAFAQKNGPAPLAVQEKPEAGAIELHMSDLETLKLRAAEYSYDFVGLHIAGSSERSFSLYATGRRRGVPSGDIHIPVLE